MGEIVGGPGGDELAESDGAEGGVLAAEGEVGVCELQRLQGGEGDGAGRTEFFEERGEGGAGRALVAFAIKGRKGEGFAVREEVVDAGDPIGSFGVDEVAKDFFGVPRAFTLAGEGPGGREAIEPGVENGGGALEDGRRLGKEGRGGRHCFTQNYFTQTLAAALRPRGTGAPATSRVKVSSTLWWSILRAEPGRMPRRSRYSRSSRSRS